MHELFDSCSCFCYSKIFKQSTELHNKGNLTCSKVLTDAHRCDEGKGNKHVCFNIKSGYKTDNSFHNNGQTTENNGNPSYIKRQGYQIKNTNDESNSGKNKTHNILFSATKPHKLLNFVDNLLHREPSFYTYGGMSILYPYRYALSRRCKEKR